MATDPLAKRNEARDLWREHWYGPHGRFSSAWRSALDKDPMLAETRMCIDMIFGWGERVRVATQMVSCVKSTGEVVVYEPALIEEPQIDHQYALGSGASSARAFAITVGQEKLDAWGIINSGRFLAGWAEVSLIAPDMAYEDRYVLMRGDMTGGCRFGALNQSLETEIVDPKETSDIGITPFVIDVALFPDAADASIGQRYPLIPDKFDGVPALRLDGLTANTFMVGWGHNISVTKVFVDGVAKLSASLSYPWSVSQVAGVDGIPYTSVVFGSGTGVWEDATTVYVNVSPFSGRPPRGVVDVIRYLVTDWSLLGPSGANQELFALAQSKIQPTAIANVLINGSGESDATTALNYIESTLCGSFPMISMCWQGGGYGPIVTDRRGTPIKARLVVGQYPLVDRISAYEETPKTALFNRFTVRYGYDPINDVYAGVAQRNPESSLLCAISDEQVGPREMAPLESVLVASEATAVYIIDWLVSHFSLPSYYVEYEGYSNLFLILNLGDNVRIFDPDIGKELTATVEVLRYTRGKVEVGLRIWALYEDLGGGATSGTGGGDSPSQSGVAQP